VLLIASLALSHALVYECLFKHVTYAVIEDGYECEATITDFGDSNTLTAITGDHLPGMTDADVNGVSSYSLNSTVIPRNLPNFFPNLEALKWDNTFLETISSEDLRPFPDLKFFWIDYNQIVSIDGNLFEHTPNLRLISIEKNQIRHVGQDLLTNLSSLQIIYFQANPCVDVIAYTQSGIQELSRDLPILCPPVPLTEPTTTEDLKEYPKNA
jgi:Leucine rich repeat